MSLSDVGAGATCVLPSHGSLRPQGWAGVGQRSWFEEQLYGVPSFSEYRMIWQRLCSTRYYILICNVLIADVLFVECEVVVMGNFLCVGFFDSRFANAE